MKQCLFLLAFSAFLSGCQADISDLQGFIASAKNQPPSALTPPPEFTQTPAAEYAVTHLRSPFALPDAPASAQAVSANQNCRTPNFQRTKSPLESYGLDAINLQGTLSVQETRLAIMMTNDGRVHKVKVGDYLGLFNGKITAIGKRTISLQQMIPDGAGCYLQQTTTLQIGGDHQEHNHV